MSGGRTVWRAKDASWWRREWIVELGEEFGPAGPAVVDWLECEAKLQNDGGLVKAGPRTIARGCFVDLVTVGHVLSRSVSLGLLSEYEESQGRFTARISWWRADQDKAMAARRKANQRGGLPVEPDDTPPESRSVPDTPGESRSVPKCPPTGQDSIKRPSRRNSAEEKASEDDKKLCRLLGELARKRNPKFKVKSRDRWLTEMRRLREVDGNSPEEIERAIRWVFDESGGKDAEFWAGVIHSPANLREHFAQVWARMTRPPLKAVPSSGTTDIDEFMRQIHGAA